MEITSILDHEFDHNVEAAEAGCSPAAGLFGYSITDGRPSTFKPIAGYLREIEQMPNFSPPAIDRFVAQYVSSNIGRTESSS